MMNSVLSYMLFTMAVLLTVLMANSCAEEVVVLSRSNKILADSIIRVQTKWIINEVDSLCELVYKENFDQAVDSVSKVRLKEIENYIPSK